MRIPTDPIAHSGVTRAPIPVQPGYIHGTDYATEMKTRLVAASGRVRWKGDMVMISDALDAELIGFEQGDGMQQVYFAM